MRGAGQAVVGRCGGGPRRVVHRGQADDDGQRGHRRQGAAPQVSGAVQVLLHCGSQQAYGQGQSGGISRW
ncbi:hypothetical protein GCM10010449_16320 [Streptomyces rectiviolaceus]|uniref:Uncharacterized protein n=1 Tax=Streptomyces rectiviolaceus TaxID=332591 RepID=A0ABP6MAB1_9ACTN